ncbi:HTH-type transcriptional regulator / antitoxin MqsA [Pseudomonas chlororaphis]|uniref:type II toxin-antitoxin system MqsA family antitoxin n=1 Tax=Pseudomonas chlororaphis TaxID=587753 RepID=UPI0039E45BD7
MKQRQCVSCGAPAGMQPFNNRSELIDYKHLLRQVDGLDGWECQACGEIEFDPASAERYASAGDQLLEDCRQFMASEMKRIRRKLHLSQKDAVRLLSGGGHNAFSRYERGEVAPPQPLFMLMRLLDRHPELMAEVHALSAQQAPPATDNQPQQPRFATS